MTAPCICQQQGYLQAHEHRPADRRWSGSRYTCKFAYCMCTAEIVADPPAGTIAAEFLEFHKKNPQVYDRLVEQALRLKGHDVEECGISLLFERLRWLYLIQTKGDNFKLNNNYRSEYARLIMKQVPELKGFFKTRTLTRSV